MVTRTIAGMVCAMLVASPAGAATNVSCWDGSFAYNVVGLREMPEEYRFRLASQNETVFAPLSPETELGWGQGYLDISFTKDTCAVIPYRNLFSCSARNVDATLTINLDASGANTTDRFRFGWIRADFMTVERAAPDSQIKLGRVLMIEGSRDNEVMTLVQDFGDKTKCDGWPDPFAIN